MKLYTNLSYLLVDGDIRINILKHHFSTDLVVITTAPGQLPEPVLMSVEEATIVYPTLSTHHLKKLQTQ